MRILYFDCFNGASGDMILGACLDAGLPLEELRRALGSLGIRDYALRADKVLRAGVSATKFRLEERADRATVAHSAHDESHAHPVHDQSHAHPVHDQSHAHPSHDRDPAHAHEADRPHHPAHAHAHSAHDHDHAHAHPAHNHDQAHAHPAHDHDHAHAHPAHPAQEGHDHSHAHDHRSLPEIERLIVQSALSPAARQKAVALFRRLAEAEAAIHRMPVERVHLHEVGALDSIIDIVGAVFAFEWLAADRVVVSPLNVGGGMVRSAHGVFPVPAPATVALVGDAPVFSRGPQAELLTPTGALLLTGHASAYGSVPPMRVRAVGYGAGDRDFADTPNVLRLLVGEAADDTNEERIVVLECEIDDMNPQIFGVLMDALYGAGALEVFYQPVQMKKSRPGTLVTVIAPPEKRSELSAIIFRETTTIGVRYQEMHRERLDRELVPVDTPYGAVRFKVARREGRVVNASPEFEDCVKLATTEGVPVKDVQAAALSAWRRIVSPEQ